MYNQQQQQYGSTATYTTATLYVQYTTAAVCTEQQTATSNLRIRQTVIDSFIYFTNAI